MRLRQALLALGVVRGREVRQQEIAQAIGMSPSRVNRYFRDNMPPLGVILKLAHALEVDPGWLAFGEDCHKASFPEWFKPQASGSPGDVQPPNAERAVNGLEHARAARRQSSATRRRSG